PPRSIVQFEKPPRAAAMDSPPLERSTPRRTDPRPAMRLGRCVVAAALSGAAGPLRMVAMVVLHDTESPVAHLRRRRGHSRHLATPQALSIGAEAAAPRLPRATDRASIAG